MKKLFFLAAFFIASTTASFAQQAKVIAFINKASWCPVCKANGARFEKDIMPMAMASKDVQIVMNDVSDDKTKTESSPMLKKAGVSKFAKQHTETGTLFFVDAKTKKLISKVSIAESDDNIKKVFMDALAKS